MRISYNNSPTGSPTRNTTFNFKHITSPQSAPTVPKWRAQLKEKNRLSAPPLHKLETAKPIAEMSADKELNDTYNPLFDSMTSISYNPGEDNEAARLYGSMSSVAKSPTPMTPKMEKRTSGYNFDELIGNN
jgi:hypothetical protein